MLFDNFNLQNTTCNFQLGFETMDQLAQIEGRPIIEYLTYEELLKNDMLPKEVQDRMTSIKCFSMFPFFFTLN